jgi:hypothetical protein
LLSVAPSAIQQQATAALSSSGGGGAVGTRGAVSVAVALPASAAALLLVHKPKAGLAHGSKGEYASIALMREHPCRMPLSIRQSLMG